MENHCKIFGMLARCRQGSGLITVRPNDKLNPDVVAAAKQVIQKPFYRSWSAVIPEEALKAENTFSVFRSTILIAGPQSAHLRQFWDGSGNFLANVHPGKSHNSCGSTNLSFTVLLSDQAFALLRPLLEDPELEQFR